MNWEMGCVMFIMWCVIVAFVFVFEPLILIWCLNQLFNLGIMSSFKDWVAVWFLQGILFGSTYFNRKGSS